MSFQPVEGGVCAAKGFLSAGVSAGIKKSGKLDLALIFSESPASAAGVFTTNLTAAAPVVVSRERVKSGSARAVVINSGCANACTGRRGVLHARDMAQTAAVTLRIEPQEALVCSTGLIGSYLPMDKIRVGITRAAAALGAGDEEAAQAIMTTDTRPKRTAVSHPDGWTVGGIAKGAGMIAPNMATMLAFITTDAVVEAGQLQSALSAAASTTFNAITIDGDTSTNDTLLAFANGASQKATSTEDFAEGLTAVCRALARMIVEDGEGTEKVVTVTVQSAADQAQAQAAARAVAGSLLVKAAAHGGDANWGRVAAALGRSGAVFDPEKLSIWMAEAPVFSHGEPARPEVVAKAREGMKSAEIAVLCDLGAGEALAEVLTTDLTPEYVRLNAEYEA